MLTHNNGFESRTGNKDTELKAVNDYLKIQPATATAVAVALNIYRPNVCRRKRTLEKCGYLSEIKIVRCPITNRLAWLLTTNSDLFPIPIPPQLTLF